jgi:hypothetical protein
MQSKAPSQAELVKLGISQPYASMILSDSDDPAKRRTPARSLAIRIFRETGWKHPSIETLTEEQMRVFEEVDPWTPPKERQDEAA